MNERSVEIFTSYNKLETDRIANYLNKNGIRSVINNPTAREFGIGSTFNISNPSMGNYKLLVLESSVDRALELIKEILPDYFQDEEDADIAADTAAGEGSGTGEMQIFTEDYTKKKSGKIAERKEVPAGLYKTLRLAGYVSFFPAAALFTLYLVMPVPGAGDIFKIIAFISGVINTIACFRCRKILHLVLALFSFGGMLFFNTLPASSPVALLQVLCLP